MTEEERAAEAWREGRILDARRGYEAIARRDPDAWPARFQLAWLEAVFGRLAPAKARALRVAGLSDRAQSLVDALVGMAEYPVPLDGAAEDWDIEVLRKRGATESSGWWDQRGKAAARAGLYGVALECLDEAERRAPGAYWDPPSWTHALPADLDGLLAAVERPFA